MILIQEHHFHRSHSVQLPSTLKTSPQARIDSLPLPEPHILPVYRNNRCTERKSLEQFQRPQILDMSGTDDAEAVVKPLRPKNTNCDCVATIVTVQIIGTVIHVTIQVNITKPCSKREYIFCKMKTPCTRVPSSIEVSLGLK